MKHGLILAAAALVGVASLGVVKLVRAGDETAPPPPVLSLRGSDPRQDFGAYSYRQAQATHWHEVMLAR